jgi:hypothetical protein
MKRLFILFTCLAFLGVGFASADDTKREMDLRVRPQVSYAPGSVLVSVWVPSASDHRALVVEADSGDFFRSSEIQLDGDRAPRAHTVVLQNLPAGEYRITASVKDSEGTKTEIHRNATVLGSGMEGIR